MSAPLTSGVWNWVKCLPSRFVSNSMNPGMERILEDYVD